MLKRSLDTSVRRWPGRDEVEKALVQWIDGLKLPGLLAVGYFGSYARNEPGPGSDLDLILVLEEAASPAWARVLELPLEELPVPTEALVFTLEEWRSLPLKRPRFAKTLAQETRWLQPPP